ncbi:MAG: hypothetical protein Q9190_004337 [Brigantiaea leucoxantha]
MASSTLQKRKRESNANTKLTKSRKIRKQTHYSSPSASASASASDSNSVTSDFPAIDLVQSDPDPDSELSSTGSQTPQKEFIENLSDSTNASDSPHSDSNTSQPKQKRKRNDPTAFATSISSILNSKLSTAKRANPILSRSATAALANTELQNSILEAKARRKLRADKKALLEKGRAKDLLQGTGGDDEEGGMSVGQMMEEEKKLKKIAQRGVVKLFNAVREAQVRGEEALKKERIVGTKRREERVGEMSKKGFLELVAGGGKKEGVEIEEA